MSDGEPTFREVIVSRLEVEARQLIALAKMVEDGDIKTPRELKQDYLPHRIKALQNATAPFRNSAHTKDRNEQ